jgi:hypothetical protein
MQKVRQMQDWAGYKAPTQPENMLNFTLGFYC